MGSSPWSELAARLIQIDTLPGPDARGSKPGDFSGVSEFSNVLPNVNHTVTVTL